MFCLWGQEPFKKRIALKNAQKKLKLLKNLQESALAVVRGDIGLKNVDLNMMLREILFRET